MGWKFEEDAKHMNQQLIFDTSVWIDFLRNKSTPQTALLTQYSGNNDPVILV